MHSIKGGVVPELEVLAVFFLAAVALGFAPGPDNIFVLTQSALHGRLAGLVVTLGLCTGLIFHTIAVAFGVAALFAASATAFTVLKLVGAAYLLYLAWQGCRPANRPWLVRITMCQACGSSIVAASL